MAGRNLLAADQQPTKGKNLLADDNTMPAVSRFKDVPPEQLQAAVEKARADRQYNDFQNRPMSFGKNLVNVFDAGNLMTEGVTGGALNKLVAGVRAPFTDLTYDQELDKARQGVRESAARQGPVGTGMAELAGLAVLPSAAAKGPNVLARLGIASTEGAGLGGLHAYGHDENVPLGAAKGAGAGVLGQGVGEGVGKVYGAAKSALTDPAFRQELWKTGKDAMGGAVFDSLFGGGFGAATALNAARHAKPLWDAGRAIPADPTAGTGLRDVLSKIIQRGGIWATGG